METDLSAPPWLANIKPGDKVIVDWNVNYRIPLIKEIKSVGKKLITLVDYDKRFNKYSGFETGDYWDRASLKEATPEAIAKIEQAIEKQEVLTRIEKVKFEKLPLSVLKEIEEAIAKHQQ